MKDREDSAKTDLQPAGAVAQRSG